MAPTRRLQPFVFILLRRTCLLCAILADFCCVHKAARPSGFKRLVLPACGRRAGRVLAAAQSRLFIARALEAQCWSVRARNQACALVRELSSRGNALEPPFLPTFCSHGFLLSVDY